MKKYTIHSSFVQIFEKKDPNYVVVQGHHDGGRLGSLDLSKANNIVYLYSSLHIIK